VSRPRGWIEAQSKATRGFIKRQSDLLFVPGGAWAVAALCLLLLAILVTVQTHRGGCLRPSGGSGAVTDEFVVRFKFPPCVRTPDRNPARASWSNPPGTLPPSSRKDFKLKADPTQSRQSQVPAPLQPLNELPSSSTVCSGTRWSRRSGLARSLQSRARNATPETSWIRCLAVRLGLKRPRRVPANNLSYPSRVRLKMSAYADATTFWARSQRSSSAPSSASLFAHEQGRTPPPGPPFN